ncbi:MAG: hypothetical protein M1827_002443 [Pycnora praestabilis]|nr:MAG: hypothetical protein M1827_002443 [Pycnora praestabilis]
MPFAQLVIGPPGSGKSTYCNGMHQFMSAIGRKCSIVNLDPANDHTSYPCALDVRDLVTLDEIMADEELGPNGGVLYALEELENNIEWLEQGLTRLGEDYVLFDCPGQVELFTHHSSLRNIFFRLQKLGYRLVVLHLTDAHALTQPSLYISTLLLSLRTMLQLDLPHLNVLTKIDLLSTYSPRLPLPLSYYAEASNLSHILRHLNHESPSLLGSSRFAALNEAIVSLVEDFSLVSFLTLAVEDKRSVMSLLQNIDRAGGYAFGGAEGANDTVWQVAMREGGGIGGMEVRDVQERWIDAREEWDEFERREREEEAERERQKAERQREDGDEGVEEVMRGVENGGVKVVRRN